ncbi:hypothetical protein GP2_013_00010, partial [Gordonia paraffinivorans NBRC 108238]
GRPQPNRGDNPYLSDYQAGSALKAVIDEYPGACLLAVHHTRKAEATDFLDAVSGTQGLAGSADFVLVLSRKRQSEEGVLAITGRDVTETEIAMTTQGGQWRLAGSTVREANAALTERRERAQMGDRSGEVLALVRAASGAVGPKDVSEKLGLDGDTAGKYLRRLASSGHIRKASRGKYVSEPSELSERISVSDTPDTSDTHLADDVCPDCGDRMVFGEDLDAGHHISCREAL